MIIYTPSAAGRILSAVDTANGINYATGALYSPIGAPSSFQNNTNIVSTFYYNNRLQPCRLSVQTSGTVPTQCSDTSHLGNILDLTYGYNLGVADNGNVSQITNNLNANRTQTYSYDEMNRVKTALTQGTSGSLCWGLDYSYDIYANLKTVFLDAGRPSCTWTTLNASVDTNNHITNTGFSYDAAGNVLSDGSFNYTWDAESELKTAAGLTYSYDGDGRRAQKSNGKLYWYGATGDILDESDASGNITDEFVFFGGKRIARRNIASGNIYYYLSDHLGSSRMIMQTGQTSACYDADFDPFGGEHVVTNACPQNYKFTGKERDAETGLDNFEARYYSSQFGRFHSADWSALTAPVPYADLGNPQTLNLYAYVKNNPLNLTDPTGHEPEGVAGQEGGSYIAARRRSHGDNVYGSGEAIDANVWEVTVNGESFFALGTEADALAAGLAQAQAQNQNQNQQNQQQSTAPANSRTDVVLYGREYTPTPQRSTAFLWEMDWYAGSCSGDKCSQSAANQKQTISLVEKVGNGEWKPTGDPIKGVAHDQISPEPKTFNQHWLVDGKQVQLVVGKDSKGNLIKTWEVHVVINKTGDRPVYSPVP
jgi:RHS repeat-associated protein